MVDHNRGYYLNGLKAWKAELQGRLRQGMARYARMDGHPDKHDQGLIVELTREFIQRLDREIAAVVDGTPPDRHMGG